MFIPLSFPINDYLYRFSLISFYNIFCIFIENLCSSFCTGLERLFKIYFQVPCSIVPFLFNRSFPIICTLSNLAFLIVIVDNIQITNQSSCHKLVKLSLFLIFCLVFFWIFYEEDNCIIFKVLFLFYIFCTFGLCHVTLSKMLMLIVKKIVLMRIFGLFFTLNVLAIFHDQE